MYRTTILSPVGPLLLASDGTAITGLWLEGQKYFAAGLDADAEENPALPVFQKASLWLEAYFAQRDLPPLPPLAPAGSPFRLSVWECLQAIPYGQTRTYVELTTEPYCPDSLPSRPGNRRQSDRVCRRIEQKEAFVETGGCFMSVYEKTLLLSLNDASSNQPASNTE